MSTQLPSPVLVLTNQLTVGGAEVYVVGVSRWLAEHGVRVAVAATPGPLVERLHPDVDYHPIPLRDVRAGLPLAAHRVRRIIRTLQPKVILANSLVTAWVGRLAGARERIPVVEVAHGWPVERYKVVAPLMRVNDRVVPVSAEVERRLRDGRLPERFLARVDNGVDLAPFAPLSDAERGKVRAEELGAGPEHVVVTSTGRFTAQKAHHHIIDLAARLAPKHPNLRFVLIGYGEREAELRELIAAAGVQERVRLLLHRSDVPRLLLGSDIFLNCSDWEGMPLSTIEAMGAGLPLVCTGTEGIGALVPDAAHGRVAPVGDVSGLAAALDELAGDGSLRTSLGDAARARAHERFSLDRMCRELVGVLAGVIA